MNEVPGWTERPLDAISTLTMGQSPPSTTVRDLNAGPGLPFLQGNAEFGEIHPSPRYVCATPMRQCLPGDTLISIRAPVGATNKADRSYCIGRGLAAVTFTAVDRDFGWHALLHAAHELRIVAQGTTFEAIGRSELASLLVALPANIAEQRRIAEVLDTVDDAIRSTERLIAKVGKVKQGLLHDLLTRGIGEDGEVRAHASEREHLYCQTSMGQVPKTWEVGLLDRFATRGSGHTPNKNVPSYWDGGIPWVSLADSDHLDNVWIRETDKEISDLGVANSSAVKHRDGTVVLSRDAGVGKSAILVGTMAVSQHFMAWTCSPRLNNVYLYYWLQHAKPRFEAIAMGSTIKTIGLPFFKRLQIAVPERPEQDAVARRMLDSDELIWRSEAELDKLRALKTGLVDDLLTGRVRVAADEDAA